MNRSKVIHIAAAIAVCMILASCCAVPDLSFSQEVIVYWNSGAGSDTMIVTITDREDVKAIAEACTKDATPGSGDCGFNVYKLIFKGEGSRVVLRPAGDSCDTIQAGESEHDNAENMYMMGRDNRKKLAKILERYGIMMDYIESE